MKPSDMHDEKITKAFAALRNSDKAIKVSPDWNSMRSNLISEGLIKKRKNRRFIILWLFGSLFLTAATSLYFYWGNNQGISKYTPYIKKETNQTKVTSDLKLRQNSLNIDSTTQKIRVELKELIITDTTLISTPNTDKVDNTTDTLFHTKENTTPANKKPIGITDEHANTDEERSRQNSATISHNEKIGSEISHSFQTKKDNQIATTSSSVNDSIVKKVGLNDTTIANDTTPVLSAEEKLDSITNNTVTESDQTNRLICPKWAVGFYFSKDFNSHAINPNRDDHWINDIEDNYDQYLSNKNQFSVGFTVHYRVNCKLQINSGFLFSKKGKFNAAIADNDSSNVTSTKFDLSGNYIDLPLTVQYSFLNNKYFSLYTGGGTVFNINSPLGSESSFQEVGADDLTYKVVLQPHSFNFSLQAKLGALYNLTDRLNGYIEATYQHGLTPIVKHATYQMPFDQFIRTYTIGIGLSYDIQ